METKIKKNGKGHDVFINNQWVFWAIGSNKNAKNELNKYQALMITNDKL